jgi:hypothetical protein
VSFIQSGGLDRARAHKIAELREEQRRLQDLQRKAVREAGRGQTHPADLFDAGDVLSLIDLIKGQ